MTGRAGRISMLVGVVVMTALAGCSTSSGVRAVEARPVGDVLPLDSDARVTTLDNGLTTIVDENDRPGGEVELRLVIDAGSALQEPDQAGAAHFLEHMMFNGTAKYPKNELTAALQHLGASFGADVNASTSYDETVYELTVPNDATAVDTAVDILHEWLTAATLTDDDVVAERGVVLDEWRQSAGSSSGRMLDAFDDVAFAGSPYADQDPIGTDAAIEAMTPELLARFYDRWYRPENATIVVVGDVDRADMIDQLGEVFGDVESRDPAPFDRPVTTWQPATSPGIAIHRDPDLTSAFVEVVLAAPDGRAAAGRPATTADLRQQVLDRLVATLIGNRLDDGLRRDATAYSSVDVDTEAPVRAMTWTGVYVTPSPGRTTDALTALLGEIRRAAADGFGDEEVQRAVDALRSDIEDARTAARSANDAQLIAAYVDHVLSGAPASDADTIADAGLAVLDAATPAVLSAQLAGRWATEQPYVFVAAPQDADGVPDRAEVEQLIETAEASGSTPGSVDAADRLMPRPAPVEEVSAVELTGDGNYVAPTELRFANGLEVVLDVTDIADGEVAVAAQRDGGISVVDDAQVASARFAPDVVAASGLGELDAVEVGHVMTSTGVELLPQLWSESSVVEGTTPTEDLETAMAYLHLLLADAQVDDHALESSLASARETSAGYTADADLAGYQALSVARFGDTPRYRPMLTPDELASVTVDSVAAAWQQLFGGASGWRIALVGDFDIDEATALARAYFGTLDAGVAPGSFVDRAAPFPDGATRQEVRAGTGSQANLTRLFEADTSGIAVGRAAVLGDLLTAVLDTRLTDTVREALGASYSPTAIVVATDRPRPSLSVEIYVTGAPDDMDRVGEVIDTELADVATNGPTAREWDDAVAARTHELGYVDNGSIAGALADMNLRPSALDDYLGSLDTLASIERSDLGALTASLFGGGRYIEVTTLPKG